MTKVRNPIHEIDEQTVLETLYAAYWTGVEEGRSDEQQRAWASAPIKPRSLAPEIEAAKLRLLQATGQMVDANARLVEHVADTLTDGRRF